MLELTHDQNLLDDVWEKVELKTRLPENMDGFFDQIGLMPHHSGCRRAYQRFFFRAKAILRWNDTLLGIYSADASRGGVRFLSPVALLPKQRARIRLPSTKEFQIEIVRCTRVDEACYDCGAVFILGH
jgi:hypothetical protein